MNSRLILAVLLWCGLFASQCALAQLPSYVPETDLVAWYGFNGNANDDSPNNVTGSAINTTALTDRGGNTQGAMGFNGTNSEVVIPFQNTLNAFPFTVSLWCRLEDDDNGGILIQRYTNASWNGWIMSVSSTENDTQTIAPGYMVASPPNCTGVVSSASCATGINHSDNLFDYLWHMLTFTVDGDSGRFYLDGILQTTQAWMGTPSSATGNSNLRIGGTDMGENFFFHGGIDDVGIWNRSLSADEVETLFLGMPPIAGCMNTNACNYAPEASIDDGSCEFNCGGCIDPCACNYEQNAVVNDGSCDYSCNVAMSFITVFHDADADGIYDNGETPLQHWPVHFDELEKTVYTNAMGMIIVPLPAGTLHYSLLNPTSNWISSTPEVVTIDVPESTVAFFGLYEPEPTTLVDADLIDEFHRHIHCTNGYESGLLLKNKGGLPLHGTLSLTCDPLFVPHAASLNGFAPSTSGAGFATWEIDNLVAWQPQMLAFAIDGPDESYAGQSFSFALQLLLLDESGNTVTEESFTLQPAVSCEAESPHLDPVPLGFTETYRYVSPGERILFTTHFFNTTDAMAQDVLVIQNLNSQQFNTDSFELLYTSAAALGCLHDDGTIDLNFADLDLPPLAQDSLSSSGFAMYAATLRSDIALDSTFHHRAYAVFDLAETVLIDSAFHTAFDCSRLLGINGGFSLCEGDSLHLSALADSAMTYRWYVEDSLFTTGRNFVDAFSQGFYTIELRVSNPVCDVVDSSQVQVLPLPTGEILQANNMLSVIGVDTYEWYYNQSPIGYGNNAPLPIEGDGVYQAMLIGEGDCTGWSNEFVVNNLEVLSREQHCYPNPATHSLYLMSGTAGGSVQLMDMFGRVVWEGVISQRQQMIDVSDLARGCYSLVVKTGEQSTIKRIVLE